ncbi:MAG: PD40 domain-containing protein [Actinomycetota bacterium]
MQPGELLLCGKRVTACALPIAAALAVVAALLIMATTEPAYASFPGENGRVAFVSERDGNHDIYTVASDGSNLRRLTSHPAWDQEPAFSPDGIRVAFSSYRNGYRDIYVIGSGGKEKNLTRNANRPDDWYTGGTSPAWSPDGRSLAFVKQGSGYEQFALFVMRADGSGQRMLRSFPTGIRLDGLGWSPDGDRIAFRSYRYPEEGSDIHVMNADGSGLTNLTGGLNAAALSPSWSPDGRKIAFAARRNGRTDVYVMEADGSNPTNLTIDEPGDSGDPAWSPDGESIAFVLDGEIHLMTADGSERKPLSEGALSGSSLDWGPSPGASLPDTKPPDTRIVRAPPEYVRDRSATFVSRSTEPGAAFRCRLDDAPYEPCSSRKTYRGLADGRHVFRVVAVDASGLRDPTPATYRWTVDTAKPTLESWTVARVSDAPATITAIVLDRLGKLRRSDIRLVVDGKAAKRFSYDPATGKLVAAKRLAPGRAHVVRVVATDPAGNRVTAVRRLKIG